MSSLLQDLKYAVRSYSHRPALTAIVLATLAIGIGSNVAIFSVANAILFKPLPYRDPERLVLIWNRSGDAESARSLVSGPDFLDYEEETTLFEEFAGAFAINGTITGEGPPEQLMMGWSTANLFKVLGVTPKIGRDFKPDDVIYVDPREMMDPNKPMPPGTVLLSHALWQQRYGGADDILGQTLELDGQRSIVVGVLPEDFRIYLPEDAGMPTNVDVWRVLPIAMDTNPREAAWLTVVSRLKEGVSLAQAQDEMDRLAEHLRQQYQVHANSKMQIELNSMHEDVVRHLRPVLWALIGAGGFVLLIACANVANLMLVRSASRQREVAVRAALGAGQGRLVRQMLLESGVLSFVGGIGGIALAWAGIRLLLSMDSGELPRIDRVTIDGPVLLFALATVLIAALLFGLAPALRTASPSLVDAIRERGTEMGGIRSNKLRSGLVVVEVALALVLLIGAGLLSRSFTALQNVDPGFRSDDVLTFSLPLPFDKYRAPTGRTEFFLRLRERLKALPGVMEAGGVTPLPLQGGDQYYIFSYGPAGISEQDYRRNKADYRWASPGYFEAMGIKLVSGRYLNESDNRDESAPVVVIDEELARKAWPGQDPVDRQLQVERFRLDDFKMEPTVVRVVGVVGRVRSESLAAESRETVYFPHKNFPYAPQTFAVRAPGNALGVVTAVQREVQALDPDVPVADLRLMESYVSGALAQVRFSLTLISVFAALALILAALGIYGVISFSVQQRTQEIGVRMAFGAEGGSILGLVVRQGMILALSGVIIGLASAFIATRLIASQLYGVTATDPVTFALISLMLVAVTAAASYVPARKAVRVDPLQALTGATG